MHPAAVLFVLAMSAVSGGAPFALAQAPNAASRPPAAVVAVIDPVKVFEAYPKAAAGKKVLDDRRASMQEAIRAIERRLEGLRLEREGLKVGSRERAYKDAELAVAAKEYEVKGKLFEAELDQMQEEWLVSVYEDIEKATVAVAKDKGVDLVVRVHADVGGTTPRERGTVFERRIVWYAADSVDLTPAVIKWMQVEFSDTSKAGTKEAAGDKPAPGDAKGGGEPKK